MSDAPQTFAQVEHDNAAASEQLLLLVNEELHPLAAAQLPLEKPDRTLQARAFVHHAYIRLMDAKKAQH